jgi:murein DD-endopeptidase MepM/ murein hydrolase activator NlpD
MKPDFDAIRRANGDWRAKLSAITDRLFPERQLYYRSRGNVRFIALNKPAQGALATALLLSFAWVAFASFNLLFQDQIIQSKNRRIAAMETAYDKLSLELDATRQHFTSLTNDLETKHKQLLDLVHYKETLEKRLTSITREFDTVSNERDRAVTLKHALREKIDRLEQNLKVTSSRNELLEDSLTRTQGRLAATESERDGVQVLHSRASTRVAELEQRLDELKDSQQELVSRVQERTQISLGEMESMIAQTGLNIAELLDQTDRGTGQGGPLVSLDSATRVSSGTDEEIKDSLSELELHLGRWEGLQQVLQSLPLSAPTEHFQLASGFGKRKDPFTDRWAMHYGLDFAAPFRTPVLATAPGTISFAGRKGPYGRLVEIDHGLGIKTRYAHLQKILVKKGQEVSFREKIGLMGSTGRSTGSHVHYEVLFKDNPQDPEKFLKAGTYVFKD